MKKMFLFASAALMLAGCVKPDDNQGGGDQTPKDPVSMQINAHYAKGWAKAMKVSIFDGTSNNMFRSQGAGANAILAGDAREVKPLYGLYPYDENASVAGKVISASFPASQTVTAGVCPDVAVGYSEDGANMEFTSVAAYLSFSLSTELTTMSAVSIASNNGETLAGAVTVDMTSTPSLSIDSELATVDLNAFEGNFKAGQTYYAAVLPGTYSDGFILYYTVGKETYELNVPGQKVLAAGQTLSLGNIEKPLSPNQMMFIGKWQVAKWGSRSVDDPTGQYAWISSNRGFSIPESAVGDVIEFKKDGSVSIDLGTDGKTYNVALEEAVSVSLTGEETWEIDESGEKPVLKLSGNAFPIFLGDELGLTTDYTVFSQSPSEIILEYLHTTVEGPSYFMVFLQPKGAETFSHTFAVGDFGLPDNDGEDGVDQEHSGPMVQDNVSWSLAIDADHEFFYWQSWGALRIGNGPWSNNGALCVRSFTLKTSDIPGSIKSVALSISHSDETNAAVCEFSATVGGKTIGTKKTITNDLTKLVISDSQGLSGEIEIKVATKSGQVCYFVRDLEVVYLN